MLQAIVENLFATYNIADYDLSALKSIGLPESLLATIDQTSLRYAASSKGSQRLSGGG